MFFDRSTDKWIEAYSFLRTSCTKWITQTTLQNTTFSEKACADNNAIM